MEEILPKVPVAETTQPSSGSSSSDVGKVSAPNRSKFASIHDYKDTENNDEEEGQRCLLKNLLCTHHLLLDRNSDL